MHTGMSVGESSCVNGSCLHTEPPCMVCSICKHAGDLAFTDKTIFPIPFTLNGYDRDDSFPFYFEPN